MLLFELPCELLYYYILLARALLILVIPVDEKLANLLSVLLGFVKCLSSPSMNALVCFMDSLTMALPSYC